MHKHIYHNVRAYHNGGAYRTIGEYRTAQAYRTVYEHTALYENTTPRKHTTRSEYTAQPENLRHSRSMYVSAALSHLASFTARGLSLPTMVVDHVSKGATAVRTSSKIKAPSPFFPVSGRSS